MMLHAGAATDMRAPLLFSGCYYLYFIEVCPQTDEPLFFPTINADVGSAWLRSALLSLPLLPSSSRPRIYSTIPVDWAR